MNPNFDFDLSDCPDVGRKEWAKGELLGKASSSGAQGQPKTGIESSRLRKMLEDRQRVR